MSSLHSDKNAMKKIFYSLIINSFMPLIFSPIRHLNEALQSSCHKSTFDKPVAESISCIFAECVPFSHIALTLFSIKTSLFLTNREES